MSETDCFPKTLRDFLFLCLSPTVRGSRSTENGNLATYGNQNLYRFFYVSTTTRIYTDYVSNLATYGNQNLYRLCFQPCCISRIYTDFFMFPPEFIPIMFPPEFIPIFLPIYSEKSSTLPRSMVRGYRILFSYFFVGFNPRNKLKISSRRPPRARERRRSTLYLKLLAQNFYYRL